jgi:hypothetical protein
MVALMIGCGNALPPATVAVPPAEPARPPASAASARPEPAGLVTEDLVIGAGPEAEKGTWVRACSA